MNDLKLVMDWTIRFVGNDVVIRYQEYFGGGYKNERVKRIDFENKLVETEVGYYKLGVAHDE